MANQIKKYQITQVQADKELLVIHPETSADIVAETETKKIMTANERTKLAGVETGAQVNKIETIKVNGVAQTISGKEIDIKITDGDFIPKSEKGTANGVATLGGDGKVPSSQLPSYVDDVLEFDNKASFPPTGETGKIYVAKDTNLSYRWGGTEYVEISPSIALGETSSTAYAGDKGKQNRADIDALKSRMGAVESKNTAQDTEITNIKNGTTKVSKAGTADNATKLAAARSISLGGDLSGSTSFDGSANVTINATLGNVGTAGTYSVVTTDTKGRVTAGGSILEVGAKSSTNTPSNSLAIGGIFFKEL